MPAPLPSVVASLLVFFTSAAVLVLEILAARLLAPYVGDTLETYTAIIGTVLAGIALGTWLGGRAADRVDPRRLLGPFVAVGGVLALASPTVVTLLGSLLPAPDPVVVVFLTGAAFFSPAAMLSTVTPVVVKLQLADLDHTGHVVGRLSALGTAGGIIGTFVTGFVLVAAWPTRPIVFVVGGVLLATGVWLWLWLRPREEGSPAPLLAIGVVVAGLLGVVGGPCEVESAYYCARVVPAEDDPSGRVLVLDTLRHSYVDLDDPAHLEFAYTQMFGDVISTVEPGAPLDVLHLGGGGFTMPRWLAATRPGSTSTVFEIDPTLLDIAREELGFRPGPDISVEIGDARLQIRDEPDDAYDVVIGDAFGGQAVPWHLTTAEFVADIRRTLEPDGVYVANIIDYPPLGFARAELATLRDAFAHVALLAQPERVAGEEGGNLVVVASDAPLDVDGIAASIAARDGEEVVVSGAALDDFIGDAQVLTDDHAPVDQLLSPPR